MVVRKIGILLILIALVFTRAPLIEVSAQDEREGIGISPTIVNLKADPGETLSGKISVTNAGLRNQPYKVYVADLSVINENNDKNFESNSDAVSPVKWFTIKVSNGELGPEATQFIDYSVTVPKTALSRGYYATIFAETLADAPDINGVVRIKRVGTLVYLSVRGDLKEKGQLVSFKYSKWYRKQPVEVELRVSNQGNVHFDVKGETKIKNIFGRTIGNANTEGIILPETTRRFAINLPLNNAFGLYKIESNITYLGASTTIGPKWVLIASPIWLIAIAIMLVFWGWVIAMKAKRRVKYKK